MSGLCVILAGGEGRRMGGGKPLRRFGGATLIGRALELASGYAASVAVAVREPAQVGGLGVPLLLDDPAIPGPLAGLASALGHARSLGAPTVLTLPCDMPTLPGDLALRLAAALQAHPGARAAVASSNGRLHPVCALWRAEALDRLAGYAASGGRSLRGFAEACDAAMVDWGDLAPDPFAGANTPAELAALQPMRLVA